MLGLPDPTFSFTIPSLHDEKLLACRVFLPEQIQRNEHVRKGAIMAHPYGPLGGSYDDPVVGIVGWEILKRGWVLITFNFRGAGESQGHTSWTGRAEVSDYASVATFTIQYLCHLASHHQKEIESTPLGLSPRIDLMLGGYSYGSMIASRCPPIPSILASLSANPLSSAATEILLRAEHLASQTNEEQLEAYGSRLDVAPRTDTPRKSSDYTISIGGFENTNMAKASHKSSDFRRSIDHISRKMHLHKPREADGSVSQGMIQPTLPMIANARIHTSYLLISPLLPPISILIALPFWKHSEGLEAQKMLSTSTTLAIFGSNDIFTAAKRLISWGNELKKVNPLFHWVEIAHAGHFWHEPGTTDELERKVGNWIDSLQGLQT